GSGCTLFHQADHRRCRKHDDRAKVFGRHVGSHGDGRGVACPGWEGGGRHARVANAMVPETGPAALPRRVGRSHTDPVTNASTILCRVHGSDRRGITGGLMAVLAESGAELYDVQQVVVRGRLTLDILFTAPEGRSTVKDLLFYGWQKGLDIDFEVVETSPAPPQSTAAVTILGQSIGPAAFGAAAGAIAEAGANIERIVRIARYPVVAYELLVSNGDFDTLRQTLMQAGKEHRFDVAVQEERLERRLKRLVVIDV